MENKQKRIVNYYQKSMIEIDKIRRENKDFSICLHVCCGPCSTHPIEFLSQYFKNIVIIFNNSNIYPFEEYSRRYEELVRYVTDFNSKNKGEIKIIKLDYDNKSYNQFLAEYGPQKEGKERCFACYRKRMEEAYKLADELGVDYFATVMTISRQKNSQILNEIGIELSKERKAKYFVSDFKKKKGIDRKKELIEEYDMYNQEYCGCVYSYSEYLTKLER